jgi:micrococcal nuclease
MLDKITRLRHRWRARTMLGRPPWRIDLWRRERRRQRSEWWRMTRAPWVVVVALLAAAIAGHQLVEPNAAAFALQGPASSGAFRLCAEQRRVNCVVDGDTIWHRGVKIRLADIDTPEVFSPRCASEAALGRQATERLLELVNAGPFEVVPIDRDADRYGRKLRILARGGRSLGDILVAEGLARRWDGARRSWCG